MDCTDAAITAVAGVGTPRAALAAFECGCCPDLRTVRVTPAPLSGVPKSEHVERSAENEQYTLSEDRYERRGVFTRGLHAIFCFVFVASPLLCYCAGIAARFRDFAERVTGRRSFAAFVFVPLLIVTTDLFD